MGVFVGADPGDELVGKGKPMPAGLAEGDANGCFGAVSQTFDVHAAVVFVDPCDHPVSEGDLGVFGVPRLDVDIQLDALARCSVEGLGLYRSEDGGATWEWVLAAAALWGVAGLLSVVQYEAAWTARHPGWDLQPLYLAATAARQGRSVYEAPMFVYPQSAAWMSLPLTHWRLTSVIQVGLAATAALLLVLAALSVYAVMADGPWRPVLVGTVAVVLIGGSIGRDEVRLGNASLLVGKLLELCFRAHHVLLVLLRLLIEELELPRWVMNVEVLLQVCLVQRGEYFLRQLGIVRFVRDADHVGLLQHFELKVGAKVNHRFIGAVLLRLKRVQNAGKEFLLVQSAVGDDLLQDVLAGDQLHF